MKRYYIQFNVGIVRYLVSYHDGIKKHNEGMDANMFNHHLSQMKIHCNLLINR